jgi:hypothetical protein
MFTQLELSSIALSVGMNSQTTTTTTNNKGVGNATTRKREEDDNKDLVSLG